MNNSIPEKTVKVVPASDLHERQDIETAVQDAYEDGYIVSKIKRVDKYVVIYFKQEVAK